MLSSTKVGHVHLHLLLHHHLLLLSKHVVLKHLQLPWIHLSLRNMHVSRHLHCPPVAAIHNNENAVRRGQDSLC